MAGRLTDTDLDVLRVLAKKGRLTDTDLDVIRQLGKLGRLTDLDIDVLREDETPGKIAIGPGGWGFIPIGTRVDRSVYVDTYEDGY